MATAMTMRAVDVSGVIGELLQDEQSDLFYFMSTADPYINRAAADLRRPLQDMIDRGTRQAGELVAVLEQLGGISRPVRPSPEFQYFAYLAVDFLLPKLYEAKRRSIERYQRALRLTPESETDVRGLLESHLAQHLRDMETLSTHVTQAASSGRAGSQTPSPAHDPSKAR
jgi:hypothetical protein